MRMVVGASIALATNRFPSIVSPLAAAPRRRDRS
jgi:hypothetical protein